MASVGDVIAALTAVDDAAAEMQAAARLAAGLLHDALDNLRPALAGSSDPDAEQTLAAWQECQDECADLVTRVAAVRRAIAAATTRLQGTGTMTTPAAETGAEVVGSAPVPSPRPSDTVTAPDGSRYPLGAAWCVDMLPPRVREGMREPTVGYVDGSFAQFRSGRDGTWSPTVTSRMAALGIRSGLNLQTHVEMKVATMMIGSGRRDATVTINHAPCGSQPAQRAWVGCHQVLEAFLPAGYILTVQGTTPNGQAFGHTYQGRA